jgi:hypothetical protein
MSYENIKNFLSLHKPQLIFALGLIVMFIVGFGTGNAMPRGKQPVTTDVSNYSVKQSVKPEIRGKEAEKSPVGEKANAPTATTGNPDPSSAQAGECTIKGNISGKNKIYHVPGGAFYERTTPEQCFDSEESAEAAGFRKSSK